MKTFNQLINEAVVAMPEFFHPMLNNPDDPDGKFWKAIANANDGGDGVDKSHFEKVTKQAKELFGAVSLLGDEYAELAAPINDIVKKLNKDSKNAVSTGTTNTEAKSLNMFVLAIKSIDSYFSNKKWYPDATVKIKAGYVPFRGALKDPKIKYRMIVRVEEPLTDSAAQVIKGVRSLNPATLDYVAGVEFNKDKTAFQILFTSTLGYKR